MNHEQANAVKELAAPVNEVLERLEWDCPECKGEGEIDIGMRWANEKPICPICKGKHIIPYTWTPQVGEWCFWDGFEDISLIIEVREDQWLKLPGCGHELPKENVTPILEWEVVEEGLEKAGHIVHIWNTETGNYYCEIDDGNDENEMHKGKGDCFQKAVYEATRALGEGVGEMIYAIETLNIEKYRLLGLKRQLLYDEIEAQTSFQGAINEICDKLKQIDWAIAELKKEMK